MRRIFHAFAALMAFFLITFLIAEALNIPLLEDPSGAMRQPGARTALASFAMLAADVLLPIPSSLLIMLNGKLFGFVSGALLSLAGVTVSAVLAFSIGRCGGRWLERSLSNDERIRAHQFLRKYGPAAVAATRPIPLLAESVGILAGATEMSWGVYLLTSVAGNIPTCAIYTAAGVASDSVPYPLLTLAVLVVLTGGIFLLIGRALAKPGKPPA